MIALRRKVFFWLGIAQPTEVGATLNAFWTQGDSRYRNMLRIDYRIPQCTEPITLAPLCHAPQANDVSLSRFPELAEARLRFLLADGSPRNSYSGSAA